MTIVCICPKGYLELWTLSYTINNQIPKLVIWHVDYFAPNDKDYTYWTIAGSNEPEFWGRETLGQL